jgi:hypothetical protein
MTERLSFDSELKLYDLSRDDLNFFISTFVQSRFPYNIKTAEYPGWIMRTFYGKNATLDDYAIARHLTGKHLVGTFPGPFTKYLCLDLDYSSDMRVTLDAILRIFPKSLAIQSSASKGIHLYHFFDSTIGVNKLQKLTKTRLNDHGIGVRRGYCEIFPQINKALRLPLGKGSYVLDEETLGPLHQNAEEGIKLIKERIIYHSITEILSQGKADNESTFSVPLPSYELTGGNTLLPNEINDPSAILNLGVANPPWDKLQGKEFKDFIDQVLRSGVQTPGTRYFLQCKLIYHFWSLGYSNQQAYDAICKWYLSHDHQSKDWKKNPDLVLRQLRSAINSFYRQAELKRYQPGARRRKLLTTTDVRNIIEMTPDYRNQKFIFSLLRYALNMKDSNSDFELPKKSIIKFDCCSNTSYQERMTFCESISLITNVREYYSQNNRARAYRINYTFVGGGDPVTCLEEGLKHLFRLSELRKRYSRQYFRHILNKGA